MRRILFFLLITANCAALAQTDTSKAQEQAAVSTGPVSPAARRAVLPAPGTSTLPTPPATGEKRVFKIRRPVEGEKPVIAEDTLASDKRKVAKRKIPKKTFYGIKTRKAFTKTVSGRKTTYELFYILKKPQDPSPYIKDIYWFNRKKRKVFVGPIPDREKQYAVLLHGPYEKRQGKVLLEQGQFYVGAKTGRWETVTNTEDEILMDKSKYLKGWPKEAKISYYDADRTKVEEVIPYVNGEQTGPYFKYYKSGVLAIEGHYENGIKTGLWREFFDGKKRLRLETQYAPDGFTTDFEPIRIREYSEKGLVVYDKAVEDKKKPK